jgi:hypothetical protein
MTDPAERDTRTARQRILNYFENSEGNQTVQQIMVGCAVSRNLADSTLSRMVDAGLVERVGKGRYRRARARAPELPSASEQSESASDGRALDEWLGWLRSWDQGNPWRGPGEAPDQDGSLVPLDVLIRWRAEKNVRAEQQAKDLALLQRLLEATGGNILKSDALADLRPVHIMLASEIPLDRIVSVIKGKHDLRCFPGNPPLSSWADLFKPVAEEHARFVVARRMVARWEERLASPSAKTRNAPPVQRALSEVPAAPRRKSLWAMHHPHLVRDSVPAVTRAADTLDTSTNTQAAREAENVPVAPAGAAAPPVVGSHPSAFIRSTAPEQHRPPGSQPAAPRAHWRAPPF